ncbi:SCO family protein [Actinoplanes sp. NPDC024001]|uniref:SCO family protein n=1 Tax=Actinoplanes sp. NPDC024001 TaxID=3154598 RepID=UPI00340B5283
MDSGAGARTASEDRVADVVRAVRADPEQRESLIDLLREDSPLYDGRGAGATARIRAWVIATFADVGLPDSGLPYVLEELESGREPLLVAAAARAVRGRAEPSPSLAGFLVRALRNVGDRDDTVTFEALRPRWPAQQPTTAAREILAGLRHVGVDAGTRAELVAVRSAYADALPPDIHQSLDELIGAAPPGHCCAPAAAARPEAGHPVAGRMSSPDIVWEDQDGARLGFDDFFLGMPSVVAFFYTRCGNPNKCSLTVTQLAALQRLFAERGLTGAARIAAVTYDPAYDLPGRMRRYGQSRGLAFGPHVRMLRATSGHLEVRRLFALRVGYTGSLVNRHAIELFLLDGNGGVAHTWSRLRWEPAEVTARVAALTGTCRTALSG